jgi:alpha-glucoside transport system substrate-binding protein
VRTRWTRPVAAVAIAALAVLAAAVGASATKTAPASPAAVSGSISFDGVWTGGEAAAFQAVINGFQKVYPKVKVNYKPVGDNLPTVLSTAVAGGNPPDMADIAQPGLVQQFVSKKALKPITYAAPVVKANFAPVWRALGTYSGKLYGLIFKASNKSTVWYNAHSFSAAGVKAPATWTQFLANAKTIHASGTPAYSIGGADGWTLTDLFENIYLRQAGQAKYLLLTAHKIKWTDASVKAALTTMGEGAR